MREVRDVKIVRLLLEEFALPGETLSHFADEVDRLTDEEQDQLVNIVREDRKELL